MGVLISITLVLLALMFLRDIRREQQTEDSGATVDRIDTRVHDLQTVVPLPSVELIGPEALREESTRFGHRARGDTVWFHVCLLLFRPQSLFDALLRPAIETPEIDSIQFILAAIESGASQALLSYWG